MAEDTVIELAKFFAEMNVNRPLFDALHDIVHDSVYDQLTEEEQR